MANTKLVPFDPSKLAERATKIAGSTAWRVKLARLLGVSAKQVGRWEQDGMAPPWLDLALRGLETGPEKKETP